MFLQPFNLPMSRIHLDFCLQSHSSGVAGLFSDKTESVSVSRYKSTWFVCTRLRENQLFPLDHLYEAYLKIKATGAYIPAPTVSLFAIPAHQGCYGYRQYTGNHCFSCSERGSFTEELISHKNTVPRFYEGLLLELVVKEWELLPRCWKIWIRLFHNSHDIYEQICIT